MISLRNFAFAFIYCLVGLGLIGYLYYSIEEHFADLADTTLQERKLVTSQQAIAASASTARCFDCSEFYSSATGQKDATTLLQYLQLQTKYVQQILDTIGQFLSAPVDPQCKTSISEYVRCLKKAVEKVSCPHTMGDIGCKVDILNSIVSKASLCVSKGTCPSVDAFVTAMKTAYDELNTKFTGCATEFSNTKSPCISLYVNAIQSKIKSGSADDSQLLVTNQAMKDEMNRTASFAAQQMF